LKQKISPDVPRSTIPQRHEWRRMGDSVDSFPVLCWIHPRAGKLPALAAPHRAKRQRLVVTRLGGVPRPLLLRLPLRARLEPCQGAGSHGRADRGSHRLRHRLRALPELRLRLGLAGGRCLVAPSQSESPKPAGVDGRNTAQFYGADVV